MRRWTALALLPAACGGGADEPTQLGNAVQVSTAEQAGSHHPSLAAGATDWGVAWELEPSDGGSESVHFARIDAAGAVSGRVDIPSAWSPRVRASGDGGLYGLSWEARATFGGPTNIFLRELGGSAADAPTQVTQLDETTYGISDHDLAWTGTSWAVAYCYERTANDMVIGFASGGAAQDLVTTGECRSVVAAFDGAKLWIAYSVDLLDTSETAVFLRALDPSGSPVGDEVRVSAGTTGALAPRVALGQGEIAVVYHDVPNDTVAFHRYDLSGVSLGETVLDLDGHAILADVAWTGASYALSWLPGPNEPEAFGVRARALRADGTPLGPAVDIQTFHNVRPTSLPVMATLDGVVGLAFADQDPPHVYIARVGGL